MRSTKTATWLLSAALLLSSYTTCVVLLAGPCFAQDDEPKGGSDEKTEDKKSGERAKGGNGAPALEVPEMPGFVYIPAGTVHPGCTWANYKARHQQGAQLKRALVYDVWGNVRAADLNIPALYLGRYEVTNAQWKHYLDTNFKVKHVCTGQDTLASLAEKYVLFRGTPLKAEWRAIYGLNAKAIMDGVLKADAEARKAAAAKGERVKPAWHPKWTLENPDPAGIRAVSRVFLPRGLELTFYSHRVPRHWYGWTKLSGLRIGREFCDIAKPPDAAFEVPKTEFFTELKLRGDNFAAYPVRDLSSNEILAFVEWAGGHLPSEYEYERGARGDWPNTNQHTFRGPWNRHVHVRIFSWGNNALASKGPLPVDDPNMKPADSQFGARHMLGNVWELTRSFYDMHPRVVPKPVVDPVIGSLFNYALTAKGGSHGDGWVMIQTSTRTGKLGLNGTLDLAQNNRADTLGFRLARHPRPGYDLLLHSILRLTFDRGRGIWNNTTPLHFNMHFMSGVDEVQFAPGGSPYVHAVKQAKGIAFAPLWISNINGTQVKTYTNHWRQGRVGAGKGYLLLGVLRSDVPLRAGVKLNQADADKLRKRREEYKRLKEAYDKQQKNKKKKKRRKKKGEEEEEPIVLPPKPPDPDRYELAMAKNKELGLWRESTVAPGEWFVVYWYGHIGLANKTLLMPPDAVILVKKGRKQKPFQRKRQPTGPSVLRLGANQDRLFLSFSVEEQLSTDPKKREEPPTPADSELWAWCEVHPDGWLRTKKKSKYSWFVNVSLPVVKDGLKQDNWK